MSTLKQYKKFVSKNKSTNNKNVKNISIKKTRIKTPRVNFNKVNQWKQNRKYNTFREIKGSFNFANDNQTLNNLEPYGKWKDGTPFSTKELRVNDYIILTISYLGGSDSLEKPHYIESVDFIDSFLPNRYITKREIEYWLELLKTSIDTQIGEQDIDNLREKYYWKAASHNKEQFQRYKKARLNNM